MGKMIAIEWKCRPERPSRWDALAAAGFFAWLSAFLLPLLPAVQRVWPTCHFRAFAGIPCGTCGFTRAFTSGARLDLAGAFAASPLGAAIFYGWGLASLWIASSWVVPALRFPRANLHPLLARFGPLAIFLGNWAWLVWAEGGE